MCSWSPSRRAPGVVSFSPPVPAGCCNSACRRRVSTEELATLHRRASRWYAEQGLIEEAIEHALAGRRCSEAQRSWWKHTFSLHSEQEQWVQLERWLRLLPEEQIQDSPSSDYSH